jgi:hypothetical protein
MIYVASGSAREVCPSFALIPITEYNLNVHFYAGYWKALASSTTFKNCKTWDCLHVLHTDIINVWNFYDPHHVMAILFVVVAYALT